MKWFEYLFIALLAATFLVFNKDENLSLLLEAAGLYYGE